MFRKILKKVDIIKCLFIIFYVFSFYLIFKIDSKLENNEYQNEKEKHICTTFVKYDKHYMVTPMTWDYKECLKCIECGKNYDE